MAAQSRAAATVKEGPPEPIPSRTRRRTTAATFTRRVVQSAASGATTSQARKTKTMESGAAARRLTAMTNIPWPKTMMRRYLTLQVRAEPAIETISAITPNVHKICSISNSKIMSSSSEWPKTIPDTDLVPEIKTNKLSSCPPRHHTSHKTSRRLKRSSWPQDNRSYWRAQRRAVVILRWPRMARVRRAPPCPLLTISDPPVTTLTVRISET